MKKFPYWKNLLPKTKLPQKEDKKDQTGYGTLYYITFYFVVITYIWSVSVTHILVGGGASPLWGRLSCGRPLQGGGIFQK